MFHLRFWIVACYVVVKTFAETNIEGNLIQHLMQGYERSARPVRNDSEAVTVRHSFDLYQIDNVDIDAKTITVLGTTKINWHDDFLEWNPNDHGSISSLYLPVDRIYKPDIILHNLRKLPEVVETDAYVHHLGVVFWEAITKSTSGCDIPKHVSKGDEVECQLEFASAKLRPVTQVNLDMVAEELVNAKKVKDTNKEWKVVGYYGRREVFHEKYVAVFYTIKLRKK